MDDETLLVVSTDFTHFGNDFSYRPFDDDIFNKIDKLDKVGLDRLAANNYEGFEAFIKKTKVPICGLNALRVLEKLLPANAYGKVLAHDTSGRFYNDENRSVSYASVNFYLSSTPRPTVMPDPVEVRNLGPLEETAATETPEPVEAAAPEAPQAAVSAPETPESETPKAPEAAVESSGPRPAPVNLTNIRRGN
jgi:hypothetical protein